MGQARMAHIAPGGIGQFGLLEMKPRFRKAVEIAHMVVMQMGENDIFYCIRINAERGSGSPQDSARTCVCAFPILPH